MSWKRAVLLARPARALEYEPVSGIQEHLRTTGGPSTILSEIVALEHDAEVTDTPPDVRYLPWPRARLVERCRGEIPRDLRCATIATLRVTHLFRKSMKKRRMTVALKVGQSSEPSDGAVGGTALAPVLFLEALARPVLGRRASSVSNRRSVDG